MILPRREEAVGWYQAAEAAQTLPLAVVEEGPRPQMEAAEVSVVLI